MAARRRVRVGSADRCERMISKQWGRRAGGGGRRGERMNLKQAEEAAVATCGVLLAVATGARLPALGLAVLLRLGRNARQHDDRGLRIAPFLRLLVWLTVVARIRCTGSLVIVPEGSGRGACAGARR